MYIISLYFYSQKENVNMKKERIYFYSSIISYCTKIAFQNQHFLNFNDLKHLNLIFWKVLISEYLCKQTINI